MNDPTVRHRPLQFSIRLLLALILLGAFVSYAVRNVRNAGMQDELIRAAIARIVSSGGSTQAIETPAGRVVEVDLSDTRIDDQLLARLLIRQLDVTELYLDRTEITDASLITIQKYKRINVLSLNEAPVTDTGLAHLSGLTSLTELNLAGTAVTDAGLAQLTGLTNLRRVDLSDTPITDAGLVHLQGLGLSEIRLDGRRVKADDFMRAAPDCVIWWNLEFPTE